ncbi:MAG: hypothetical protein K0R25_1110 [Rickettsiaceae bacterium]|jgi:hypothetical protein|nr:hypothetical protein [Rickettsiaceae bacterium]
MPENSKGSKELSMSDSQAVIALENKMSLSLKDRKGILSWLSEPGNNLSFDEIIEIIKSFGDLDSEEKYSEIEKIWVEKSKENLSSDEFIDLMIQLNQNDFSRIIRLYKMSAITHNELPYLCIMSYLENETSQANLFSKFINGDLLQKTPADIKIIKKFISRLKNNYVALNFLEAIKEKEILGEEDIAEIKGDIKRKEQQSVVASNKSKPIDDLKKKLSSLLSNQNSEGNRIKILESWFEEQGNNLGAEDIKEILDSKEIVNFSSSYTPRLAKLCIEKLKPNLSTNDLAQIIVKLGIKYYHYTNSSLYEKALLPNSEIITLCKILHPDDEISQAELFNQFIEDRILQKTPTDIRIIKNFISGLRSDEAVYMVFRRAQTPLFREMDNPEEWNMLEQQDLLEIFENRIGNKYQSIASLLENTKYINFLTEEGSKYFHSMIERLRRDEALPEEELKESDLSPMDELKRNLSLLLNNRDVLEFPHKEPINNKALDGFISLLHEKAENREAYSILLSWLKENSDHVLNIGLAELVKKTVNLSYHHCNDILRIWLNNPKNNISFDEIVKIANLEKEEITSHDIVLAWLKKAENNIDLEQLIKIKESFKGFEDPNKKIIPNVETGNNLLSNWIGKPENNISPDQFKWLSPLLLKEQRDQFLLTLIHKFENSHGLGIEEFRKFTSLTDNQNTKDNAIFFWIRQNNCSVNDIINILKSDLAHITNQEEFRTIIALWKETELSNQDIPRICRGLYPNNEISQTYLFFQFLNYGLLQQTPDDIEIIKQFISNLRTDYIALDTLRAAQNYLRERDILEIAKDRIGSKYHVIPSLLGDAKLEDCLTEEGITTLKELFGENIDDITLKSVFAYYDINDDMGNFLALLKQEFREQMAENFHPTENYAYISESEAEKLTILFDDLGLPKMEYLTRYLKSKVQFEEILELSQETIDDCQINFQDSLVAPEQHPELIEEFKRLLATKEENLADKEIYSFFKTLLNLDIEISEKNQEKLKEYFVRNKSKLMCLLQKEGGLAGLTNSIGSLEDGCVANFASKVETEILKVLIPDSCARLLYCVFSEKIAVPILNNSGEDHLTDQASGVSILDLPVIDNSLISYKGLVEELKKSFRDSEGNFIPKRSDLIEELVGGEENVTKLTKRLNDLSEEKSGDEFDNYQTDYIDIGTYLVLKKALPEILNDQSLEKFKTDCEKIFPDLEQMHNEEEKEREEKERPSASPEPIDIHPQIQQQAGREN